MEPMDLDSDGDSSFRRDEISDMEIVSNSPAVDRNAVKETPSFEKLESALSSILSFDKSPTKSSGSCSQEFIGSNVNTHDPLSKSVTKNVKRGYGIREDEDDFISHYSATMNRSESSDSIRKRSTVTSNNQLESSKQSQVNDCNIAKSKARSLILKKTEPSCQIQRSRCFTLFLKFCKFSAFLLLGVFCILTVISYIKMQSCYTGKHFSKSVLEMDLDSNVYGQHIAVNIIPIKLEAYLQKFHQEANAHIECKPLVLSFHGWTGVGKNFVSKIISDTLKHTKWTNFIIPYHFPHEAFQNEYMTQIKTWIINNVTDCAINVVVIDEMDKAYSDVLEGIVGAINALTKPCNQAAPTIFLLLSNSFAVDINRAFLSFMIASHQNVREQFIFQDYSSVSEENSNSWFSHLSNQNLIDAFVPFLPLEKKHVVQCIKRELVSKRFSTDSKSIDRILKELSFSVFGELELSNTGCKRVADKVDLIMLDEN